jgi:hypothetical protein
MRASLHPLLRRTIAVLGVAGALLLLAVSSLAFAQP